MAVNIVTATRRYLVTFPALTTLLGSDATYSAYIFRQRSYVELEGSGSAAIVLNYRGQFSGKPQHHTNNFARVQCEIYVDPLRDASSRPLSETTPEDRALEISLVLDSILHRTTFEDFLIEPTVRVLNSHNIAAEEPVAVPGGDGLVRAVNIYGMVVG